MDLPVFSGTTQLFESSLHAFFFTWSFPALLSFPSIHSAPMLLQPNYNTRTSFFKKRMSLAESLARRSTRRAFRKIASPLGGLPKGARKVPATLAPRSARAQIDGSRLVPCCCSSIVRSCTPGGSGTHVSWKEAKSRGDLEGGVDPLDWRSQRRIGPLTVAGSFSTSRTASCQWFRQRTDTCMK